MFEFLKKIINFFRREKPEPEVEVPKLPEAPLYRPPEDRARRSSSHRPIGSFTGPGMRKLRRSGRTARHHERAMGVDHKLSMRDVEEKKKRRR